MAIRALGGLAVLLPPIPSLTTLVLMVPALVIAFTFHEFAHAAVATAFGDPTPRRAGRLTLEPLAHLDFLGAFCLLFLGFGWAKPTPTQPANYRNRFWGEIWVSSAGVLMNLLLAFLFVIPLLLLGSGVFGRANTYLLKALQECVWFNLVLVVFNLLPLPPLDGWHIIRPLLPPKTRWTLGAQFERYGPFIMLLLLLTGIISLIMRPLLNGLENAVYGAATALLRLFL